MKNYDIGILTFWNVPNYGTFVQAYALQKVIQSLAPDKTVVQINHLDNLHYNFYYNQKKYLLSQKIWTRSFWQGVFSTTPIRSQREVNFQNAYNTIPHTETITKKNLSDYSFQKVFLGSDIIWDYSIPVFHNDEMLFGIGISSKKYSYAASFGTVDVDAKLPDYVAKGLQGMSGISVRDQKSSHMVEKNMNLKPSIVLDPTWLWDFNHDENVITSRDSHYLLVYGQDFSEGYIDGIRKYASENNLSIIALDCNDDHYSWCDKVVKQENLSPFEWIGYFKYAEVIATSTFHGITFSLIFKKKFAFCKTDFIMAKISDFLEELGLSTMFDCDDVAQILNAEWDYEHIEEIIDGKKSTSIEFLKNALED